MAARFPLKLGFFRTKGAFCFWLLATAFVFPTARSAWLTDDFSFSPADRGYSVAGNNNQYWRNEGGNPGGFLAITYPEDNQSTKLLLPELDQGRLVKAVRIEADLRIGNNESLTAGKGFSISFIRGHDPILTNPAMPDALFAGGVPEGGGTSGIAVLFDPSSGGMLPDGPDTEGIIVRVDNITLNRTSLPTRYGSCNDNTSLQTGNRDDGFWANGGDPRSANSWQSLCWQPILIDLDETGKLTVRWKGRSILESFQTTYYPSVGRLLLAGRTGSENQHIHVDNLRVTTVIVREPEPPVVGNITASTPGGAPPKLFDRIVLEAQVQSAAPATYRWLRNDTPIPGAATPQYVIPSATKLDQGAYVLEVTNPAGTTRSAPLQLEILLPLPVIEQVTLSTSSGSAPKDGDRIVFAVQAQSPEPMTYQWFFNNTAIPGATRPEFIIEIASLADSGVYAVAVSNSAGTSRSGDVNLSVTAVPPVVGPAVISTAGGTPPVPGDTVTISASVQTPSPATFQWLLNDSPIDGATDATLVIPSAALEHEGAYVLRVTNAGGSATSAPAVLTLRVEPPVVSAILVSSQHGQAPRRGDSVTMSVEVTSSVPVTYQWFFNNFGLPGANSPAFVIPAATLENQGSYSVEVSNRAAARRSPALQLTLALDLPTVSAITIASPSGPAPLLGDPVTLSVQAASSLPLTYQWFFNSAAILGATSAQHVIPSATPLHQGEYAVEVANADGTVRSAPVQLLLRATPHGPAVRVTTIAGTNISGRIDAPRGADARFSFPNGLAHVGSGVVAVADGNNNAIRLVDRSGQTITFAGANPPGWFDAAAALAQFNFPLGLRTDRALDLLVADTENNRIRKVLAFGLRNVLTLAGNGSRGYKDGPAAQAEFDFVNDLVADHAGNIFVIEFNNHTVRKISAEGQVTTLAGSGAAGFLNGRGRDARLSKPAGIEIDNEGNLYVTEWGNHAIRKIDPSGLVTTLAGTNAPGFLDGAGAAARFKEPDGITIDPMGNLYVSEHGNHSVRRIDPAGNVVTIAGLGIGGLRDGDRQTALFNAPGGILWHPDGALWVSDTDNHALRRIEFLSSTNTGAAELFIALHPALTIVGQPGAAYRIEAAETTSAGTPLQWIAIDTVRLAGEVHHWFDPQPVTRAQRFYRAMKLDDP